MKLPLNGPKKCLKLWALPRMKRPRCCKTAFPRQLRGIQEYNSKVVEFAQANTQSHIEFVQRLAGVKSPFDCVEIFQDHSRQQLETLTEQAKELAKLGEEIAGSASTAHNGC